MPKRVGIIAAILATVMLSGCGGFSSDGFTTTHTNIRHYDVDGKRVACLVLTTNKGTATVSCDWQDAR